MGIFRFGLTALAAHVDVVSGLLMIESEAGISCIADYRLRALTSTGRRFRYAAGGFVSGQHHHSFTGCIGLDQDGRRCYSDPSFLLYLFVIAFDIVPVSP